jgi:hypothetical protein
LQGVHVGPTIDIFLDKVLLELTSRFRVIPAVVDIKDEFFRANRFDKLFEFAVIAVRAVRDFVVEGHVAVVFVIPAGEDNKNGRLVPVALVHTEENKGKIKGTYS